MTDKLYNGPGTYEIHGTKWPDEHITSVYTVKGASELMARVVEIEEFSETAVTVTKREAQDE